ncbi:MAG: polyprenyl synthetase family protein [Planctomycetes bacterium]|nr:polyprenyl synthetase family protein [Planctomycetota bacterium]
MSEPSLADIKKAISEAGARIDSLMEEILPRNPSDLLSEMIWYHLETGGKRVRPALCLLTCEALGGKADGAMHFALAIEILHNMFLVHDDIEDGDEVRRDRPAVWVKYGVPNAVNAGDYLLAKAQEIILRSAVDAETKLKLLDAFSLTCCATIEGQALDINSRADENFTIEKYLHTVRKKTGCYLACGLVGGAMVAGADDAVIDALWKLGDNMGPAFQIRDDVIDLTIGKGRGGELGCDIREGKASILYAYAIGKTDGKDAKHLREIMGKPRAETTRTDVDWVIDLYKRCGALDHASTYADELVQEAYTVIDSLPVASKGFFRQLARFMAERKS